MRTACQTFIFIILSIGVNAQTDTLNKPTFWLRPYGEIGITFLQNDILKQHYLTNTALRWGFGLRAGSSKNNNVLLNIKYAIAGTRLEYINNQNVKLDSMLSFQDLTLALDIAVKRINSKIIKISPGLISSNIIDDFNNNSGKGYGIQMGIGYEGTVFKNSRVYVGYSYNYIKLNSEPVKNSPARFSDYDTQNLTIGFIL